MFRLFKAFFVVSNLAACVTVSEPTVVADGERAALTRIELGFNYLDSGDSANAKLNFERAMEFAPKLQQAHVAIAFYYQQVGEVGKAHKAYQLGISTANQRGDLHNNYGVFLCGLGQYDAAQTQFEQAVIQPGYYAMAASFENSGLCALKAQQTELAFRAFVRAVEHQPQRYQATLQLAKLEIEKGNQADARLRLHKFHQRYGYQRSSILLLIELEKQADNWSMVEKYQLLLARTVAVSQ